MAGQPPEPSFQPAGQEQNLTQGRPAWQPPAYPPPPPPGSSPQQAYPAPPGSGGQQVYAAPPYGAPDQGYAAADPGYPARDQGYAAPDQGYAGPEQGRAAEQPYPGLGAGQGQGQGYPGYQPGYGAQQGEAQGQGAPTPPPQWQGIAGVTPPAARTKRRGEKGFLGSLFDFSFSTFVTPKIIKVLYVLLTLWTVLIGVVILVVGFKEGGFWGGLFTLVIIEPIFVLLTLGVYRVVLEAFMVIFRIYEETRKISERTQSQV